MNIGSATSSYMGIQQLGQTQRKEPPSAADFASQILSNSDTNSDSLISSDELSISSDLFSSIDSNSDGSLSSSELEESISAQLDSMKNQTLTPKEFGDFLSQLGIEVPTPPEHKGHHGGPDTTQMANDIFASKDANTDGTLSLDELGIDQSLFTSFDGNEDGNITQEELANGLNSLFESAKNGEISKEDFESTLSSLGVEAPSAPPQGAGMMAAGGGSNSESQTYDDADLNQDGTVSAAEQAIYDATNSQTQASMTDMQEYTLNLVSTLIDALKSQQDSNQNEPKLSSYKQIMSMTNEQFQNGQTKDSLNTYLKNLVS